ncbi:MAG TPA: ABC transporter ATP-binding protein [Anaeromyxobacter sp.]|nr:ABC transporter ATP-binding protein [Anaeromyxobacter sp.]
MTRSVAATGPVAEPASAPLLSARRLSKDYGKLRVVSSLSFDVREGEILGVIGPNGAGKTTLFALLSGSLAPTDGEVRFRGRPITRLGPDRRCHLGIARTFQIVRPFAELTVRENVQAAAIYGKPGRRPAAEIARDVEEILVATGLAPQAAELARTLSLPQQKRLEVARALATRPAVLLLDEVLAGLNPRAVDEAIPLLRSLNEEHGIALLVIEHNLRAILGLSHRVLVLNFGERIFEGTPAAAVADPEVVRAYLGEGARA